MLKTIYIGIFSVAALTFCSSLCHAGTIHEAVMEGNIDEVVRLLDTGMNPDGEIRKSRVDTPLHSAAWRGKTKIAEELIRHKADVCAMNKSGQTPLWIAAYNGDVQLVQLLLDNGALHVINQCDLRKYETPLVVAVRHNYPEVAKMLIKSGADVTIADPSKRTPLHLAAQEGQVELIQLLCDRGAHINAETTGYGYTPLQLAASAGETKAMEALVQRGADVNVRSWPGKTVYDMLERYNQFNH